MAIVAIAYSDEDVTKLTTIFGTVATRGFRALTPNKCKYLGHAKSKTKMLRHPSVRLDVRRFEPFRERRSRTVSYVR